MNIEIFLKFLRQLIKNQYKKIFLILDNLRVHHAKKVKEWQQKHKDKIEFYFLPAYSPELNPDELVNQDVKEKCPPKFRPLYLIFHRLYFL